MILDTGLQWSERVPVSVHVGNKADIFFLTAIHLYITFQCMKLFFIRVSGYMFLKTSGLNTCDLNPALVRVFFKMNELILVSLY